MRTSTQLALQAALNNEGAYIEIKEILEEFGLEEGANSDPKQYVVEKAFVD